MLPVAPLMIEHRLIERMIKLMGIEVDTMRGGRGPEPGFIAVAVDFIKVYADKLHHGKEEDILFASLAKKNMSREHAKIMDELLREHAIGRTLIEKLNESLNAYRQGEKQAMKGILKNMGLLVDLYPRHVEKEDKHFFIPVMEYLKKSEKEEMLRKSYEFDKRFIHSRYNDIVGSWERSRGHGQP